MSTHKGKSNEQSAAEAVVEGFRQSLGPFVTAAETTRMPMMFTDARDATHPLVFVNQAFLNLTGYQEHEVLGESFLSLMERGTDPEMLTEIRTAFRGGRDLEPVVRYRRKDNTSIWVALFIAPVLTSEGDIAQHFISFVDITRHQDEQDRLMRRMGKAESS